MAVGDGVNRRTALRLLGGALAVPLVLDSATSRAAAGFVDIVEGGEDRAILVTADNPDPQENNAALTLRVYVATATGVSLEVVTASTWESVEPADDRVPIYVGRGVCASLEPDLSLMDGDGFVISVGPEAIMVAGPTPWGTRFGAYEFLERFVGVRWLMPGPGGEDVPSMSELRVAPQTVRQEPAIMSRQIYPFGTGTGWNTTAIGPLWASRNRMHERLRYSHNLATIFSPAVYGDREEFYPILNGVRYIPSATARAGWQPRFTEPGTITEAARVITEFFSANPRELSYSVGINDAGGFSEDEYGPHDIGSDGQYSFSNLYYRWVNAVAEEVAAVHPDKILGLIAYNEVALPPTFTLHPNVMPFITRDRYGWVDHDIEAADREHHARWLDVAQRVGWYDYVWGAPFLAPRIYGAALRKAYSFAATHRVDGVFAESAANWGEGPKLWMYGRLLWNPDQDANQLRNEWCTRVAGPVAASDLVKYYQSWENVWSNDIPATSWFANGASSSYYGYVDPSYVSGIDPGVLAQAREHIESAVARAVTPAQRTRVGVLSQVFDFYEASLLSYPRRTAPPNDLLSARGLVNEVVTTLETTADLAEKRYALLDQFAANPLLSQTPHGRKAGLAWSGWNFHTLWNLARFIADRSRGHEALQHDVVRLIGTTTSDRIRAYLQLLLDVAAGKLYNAALNPSFDESSTEPWLIEYASPPREPAGVTTSVVDHGTASLRIPGPARAGGISQRTEAKPGFFRHAARFYTAAGDDHRQSRIVPTWLVYDAQGKVLQVFRGEALALKDTAGRWAEFAHMEILPEGTTSIRCYVSLLGLTHGTTLYLDNAEMSQIS